jgi:hypothetical protein
LDRIYNWQTSTTQWDASGSRCSVRVGQDDDYIGDAVAIAAFRGDADTAFAYLEKTFESNPTSAKGLVQNAYVMRLQNDPRWLPLLRKMGVDPETLGKIRFTVTLPAGA